MMTKNEIVFTSNNNWKRGKYWCKNCSMVIEVCAHVILWIESFIQRFYMLLAKEIISNTIFLSDKFKVSIEMYDKFCEKIEKCSSSFEIIQIEPKSKSNTKWHIGQKFCGETNYTAVCSIQL